MWLCTFLWEMHNPRPVEHFLKIGATPLKCVLHIFFEKRATPLILLTFIFRERCNASFVVFLNSLHLQKLNARIKCELRFSLGNRQSKSSCTFLEEWNNFTKMWVVPLFEKCATPINPTWIYLWERRNSSFLCFLFLFHYDKCETKRQVGLFSEKPTTQVKFHISWRMEQLPLKCELNLLMWGGFRTPPHHVHQ
jgi:hypothetical protein